mgnify:CR=1 FL=1
MHAVSDKCVRTFYYLFLLLLPFGNARANPNLQNMKRSLNTADEIPNNYYDYRWFSIIWMGERTTK